MNKPTIFFDLETTGTDLDDDKIVQIAAIMLSPDMREMGESKNVLINPGRPIPKEATEVHGITDEMVKDKPTFGQYATGIFKYLDGSNLAGFNILRFDIPLLAEEFARVGITWPAPGTLYFDVHNIFREKEKRDLASAVKFYTGSELINAHDALSDVTGTIEAFRGQLKMYEDLAAMTPESLSEYCVGEKSLDLAGKIGVNENGQAVYAFGKDKGKVIKDNPGFAYWMLKQKFTTNTKNVLNKILGYGSRK